MTTDDISLVDRAVEGDQEAFAVLLDRHYDKMYALCYKLTGSSDWAQDIVQDVCLSLDAKLANFEGKSLFTTWLYRVVLNAVHDARRKHNTYTKALKGWGDVEIHLRAAREKNEHQREWLAQAAHSLPSELRDTLVLVLDGFSHDQIGEMLDVPPGTVSWRISNIKTRLRCFEEEENDG